MMMNMKCVISIVSIKSNDCSSSIALICVLNLHNAPSSDKTVAQEQ